MNEQEFHYLGYVKTDDIVKYCEKMARDYELTNPSYSDACSDMANKCLDLSNEDITEVKHGEWIDEEVNFGGIYGGIATQVIFYCSECEEQSDYKTNFCPNCGADMRGKVNERNKEDN